MSTLDTGMKQERTINLGEAIREGLEQAAQEDPTVLHFAEGVEDPTAVFGTVKGIGKTIDIELMRGNQRMMTRLKLGALPD